jgi:hypothetical protein
VHHSTTQQQKSCWQKHLENFACDYWKHAEASLKTNTRNHNRKYTRSLLPGHMKHVERLPDSNPGSITLKDTKVLTCWYEPAPHDYLVQEAHCTTSV